jgi:hypothetical protein
MKKFLFLVILFVSFSSLAKSMEGSLGMGIGWNNGASLLNPNAYVTKIGLSSNLAIEPEFYLSAQKSGIMGGAYTEYGISLLLDIIMKEHEKTNVYFKGGLVLDVDNPPTTNATTNWGFAFGFGIEHFISDFFAIDLSALSSYVVTSYGEELPEDASNPYNFYLGNGNLRIGALWYY